MDKNTYIEQEKFKVTQFTASLILGAGAVSIALLSILDYFVTPENHIKFLIYRIATSFFLVVLLVVLSVSVATGVAPWLML